MSSTKILSPEDERQKIIARVKKAMMVEQFGKDLILSLDLDPVYVALAGANLKSDVLKRWLVSYVSFYSTGAASYMAQFEGAEFWKVFETAALNEEPNPIGGRWPRGAERRYYRGGQALDSYSELVQKYARPEQMMDFIVGDDGLPRTVRDVMDRVQTHRGFGPWIAFKMSDLIDRVLGQPVDFEDGVIFMFKDPAEAADRVWEIAWGNQPSRNQRKVVCDILKSCYRDILAPPLFDRPINIQEVETVLCKWKSHTNGHYPLGKDTADVLHSLEEWSTVTPIARYLHRGLSEAIYNA